MARNIIDSYSGDGKEGCIGPWCDSSTQLQLAQGLQGAKALPVSPSDRKRQEQHAAGSDWFAPVASLQAPRDSCLGTAGFLKGHL